MSAQKKRDARTKAAPPKRIPIRRRDILILLGFWLAGCAIVAILVGFFYSNISPQELPTPQPVATYTVEFSGDTAKIVYLKALANAQSWSDDVALVALSTQWVNSTGSSLGQPGNWDFRFYSPRHKRLYFVVITPEGKVLGRAHFRELRQGPLLVDPTEWLVDSDEALRTWFNQGGGPFLQAYTENQVELLLRPTSQGLVWEVIGFSSDQSQMHYVPISANSGEVLN
ncbi:MAG: hypothetical protein FOGNACKC_02364 [Anaerolineae bacterium]|nr:hypothetical protein [Anaerolineae bacterium]